MTHRYTTRAQDAAFVLSRLTDARRPWAVGDACLSYRGDVQTKVVKIEGSLVHLANGDSMHVSKMRSVK